MKLLDGKKIAQEMLSRLKTEISRTGKKPGLGVILAGDDPASEIYVNFKEKAAREAGMIFKKIRLPKNSSESAVLKAVEKFNRDEEISGIIVQLPLPKGISKNKIIGAIAPSKDADGFHRESVQRFLENFEEIPPVFPRAVLKMIEESGEKMKNKKALVVANSKEFGLIMKIALNRLGARADYLLSKNFSENEKKIKKFDVIITACGQPGIIQGEMLKKSALVIDGGITKKGKKVLGDVDFESAQKTAGFLSPVPGGVGPVTIACLLESVWKLNVK